MALIVAVVCMQDIERDIREIDSKDELPGDRFHDVMSVSTPSPPHSSPLTPSPGIPEGGGREGSRSGGALFADETRVPTGGCLLRGGP